jgi:adenylate kinase
MIIAISGTPGTGKTVVARLLARKLDANLISIHDIIGQKKIPYKQDRIRNTKIVDVKKLQQVVNRLIINNKMNLIEGHLSHLLNADKVFVLRCNPIVLKKRLGRRDWTRNKISENVLAEMLDEIAAASPKHFEIDTSRTNAKQVADEIMRIIKSPKYYKNPKINWLDRKFYNILFSLERSL